MPNATQLTAIASINHRRSFQSSPTRLRLHALAAGMSCWGSSFALMWERERRQSGLPVSETWPPPRNSWPEHSPWNAGSSRLPKYQKSARKLEPKVFLAPVKPAPAAALSWESRLPRGAYSRVDRVSFAAMHFWVFCIQFWQLELRLISCVSNGYYCQSHLKCRFPITRSQHSLTSLAWKGILVPRQAPSLFRPTAFEYHYYSFKRY